MTVSPFKLAARVGVPALLISVLFLAPPLLADVTGTVFDDVDFDGVRTAADAPVGGVVVNAYDDSGALVGNSPQTSDASGAYTLTGVSGTVRVEFTIPAGLGFDPGVSGSSNVSSVAFVADGAALDFGVNRAAAFCQDSPLMATTCFVAGDPERADFPGPLGIDEALVAFSSSLTGAIAEGARASDIGSVWGLAYHRRHRRLFSSAFVKAHAGLLNAPGGGGRLGAIWITDFSGGDPAVVAPGNELFVDLDALGINVGAIVDNTARDLGLAGDPEEDLPAFETVGTIGLGDIDLSEDGRTLYVVSLASKQVVSLDLTSFNADPTARPSAATPLPAYPNPACQNGEDRPFGLKVRGDQVFLGVVCDASSGTDADLDARVFVFNQATNAWGTALAPFSLDFTRGFTHNRTCNTWQPWSEDPADIQTSQSGAFEGRCWPQPILSDIEFDAAGAMILGFTDRGAHQLGAGQPLPGAVPGTPDYTTVGVSGGDVMRAVPNGAAYALESGGTTSAGGGCGPVGEGVGDGEFYCEDFGAVTGPRHFETSLGGLASRFGTNDTLMTATVPSANESAGIYALSNATGRTTQRYTIYEDFPQQNDGSYNKGAGLGDLELLCEAPPIQIGNRFWLDADGDGLQDPGESAIAGVRLVLFDANGTPVGQAITDANGNYYFDLVQPTVLGDGDPNASDSLVVLDNPFDAQFRIEIAADNFDVGGPLEGLEITAANATGEAVDSDAVALAGGGVGVELTTGAPGENDHTFDFGVRQIPVGEYDLAVIKTTTASQVEPGSNVAFTITVFNQGNIDAQQIQLIDVTSQAHPSLPTTQVPQWDAFSVALNQPGNTGGSVSVPYSWAQSGADGLLTISGTVPAGGFVTVPVVLTLRSDFDTSSGENAYNYVEITADDGDDVDSTPEGETPAGPGSGNTDVLVDNTTDNSNGDEDDHDVAGVDVDAGTAGEYDLAVLKTTQASGVEPGAAVTFTITVFNQGDVDASLIQLVDVVSQAHPSLPVTQFPQWDAFQAALNPGGTTGGSVNLPYGWAATGNDGLLTITGTLPAGGFVTVPVVLTLRDDFDTEANENAYNYVEILADDGDDVDSTPEGETPAGPGSGNTDTLVDNVVDNSSGDEDDHDVAGVDVTAGTSPTFDLALRKTHVSGNAVAGELVTFLIEVLNQGTIDADDIEIIDYVDVAHPDQSLGFDQWEVFNVGDNPNGITGGVGLPYVWSVAGVATISGTLPQARA